MLVGIHQLHYLPWLRYFEKIERCDIFVVLDNIQFNKNGWQNRNRIKTATGPGLLTVPVFARSGQRLDEVRIDNGADWRKKHWRTIEQSYGRSPHFGEYAGFLEGTYARDWETLNALNRHMLDFFMGALRVTTPVKYASELDVPGEATERLVNLIHAVGGDAYYSGACALDTYLDEETLRAAEIELVLQEWHAPEYPQSHGDFVPDLAVLDLLMNCGASSLDMLMGQRT